MRRREALAEDFFTRVAKLVAQAESVKMTGWTPGQLLKWADQHGHAVHSKFRALAKTNRKVSQELFIPGTMPRSVISRLAVKVAFEMEQESGRRAKSNEVMALLHDMADCGKEAGVLVGSNRATNTIEWATVRGEVATYTENACRKALVTWNDSRPADVSEGVNI
jgi:hypothetical protein